MNNDTQKDKFRFVEYSAEAAERIGYSDYSYWKSADGFYQYLDAGKSENQCDFVLTKRQKPVDEFVYIVLSPTSATN